MYRRLLIIIALLAIVSLGCGHSGGNSSDHQQGRITLAVSNAPPDATCIQVIVRGTTTVERDVDVSAGQSTVLLLEGLPEGNDTITVNAYSGSCSALTTMSVPTWIGDPVVVFVTTVPVSVTVNLHPNTQNGRVSVDVNFVVDAGTDTAAADAGSPDDAQPDASEPDAAQPDASEPDASEPDAAQPDATGPDATEVDAGSDSAVVTDPNCDTCELEQCPEFRTGCDTFTGTDRDLCLAVIACVRLSSCHQNNTLDCYCGTADAAQCLSTSGTIANGACKAEIEAGQKTTDPVAIQNQYTDVTFPAGAAMQLMLCDNAVCSAECIPYGAP
jgi:hypothetical protein